MPAAPRSPADSSEPIADRTVVIRRVIAAPARLLFLAYTTPEHVMKWFGPPGYPLTLCEMDFRVGGRYRFAMTGPDGRQNTPFGGTYLAIEPNAKIAYDNRFEEDGAETMVMTTTFHESDGRTTLTLETVFGSVAMRNLHVGSGFEQGTGAAFDQLAQTVADMGRPPSAP